MRMPILLLFMSLSLSWASVSAAQSSPSRYAVVSDDKGDDTAGLQRYLDEIKKRGHRQRPPLPAGRMIISDTLKVNKSMGLKIEGSGGQNRSTSTGWNPFRTGTILVWNGPADKPMLELTGCTGLVLEGINFEGGVEESRDESQETRAGSGSTGSGPPTLNSRRGPASQCILIRDGGGSLNIAIRDCGFVGGRVGIQCGAEHRESTCANITYDNCHFERQTEACVRIMNLQSLEHFFLRPKFAYAPIAIDVQAGGDVSVQGGGTFEMDTFLKLGRVGSNTRGFDVLSARFDGKNTRTAWLAFEDAETARTYGAITFANCSQNNGQKVSDLPLVTVAPGSRVVLRECSFASPPLIDGNLAHIYSDRRAGGELVVENCDGLHGQRLPEYVEAKGSKAYYMFLRCGDLYHPTGSATNYPASALGGG